MWFFGNDGRDVPFVYENNSSALKAYQWCPPLTSIINRKVQSHLNGKTWVLNRDGKAKGKESEKADAKKIRTLFETPNKMESGDVFEGRLKAFIQIYGWCIVYPVLPYGYKDAIDAESMWIIPPYACEIEENQTYQLYQTSTTDIVRRIKICGKNKYTYVDIDKVWIFKDFVPNTASPILPESRVCSLKLPIKNVISCYETRHELLEYAGAQGVFSPDAGDGTGPILFTPEEKEQIQDDFRRYGNKRKQWKYIFSPRRLHWESVGKPTKDLMLFEEVQDDTREIAVGYGYPHFLLGLKDATYENQAAAERSLYQNTIMPEAQSMYKDWNRLFKTEERGIIIEKDFSEIPCLQEDKKYAAEWRQTMGVALLEEWKAGFIKYNRVLELLNEDPVPDGDVYYDEWLARNPGRQQAQLIPITNVNNGTETTAAATA